MKKYKLLLGLVPCIALFGCVTARINGYCRSRTLSQDSVEKTVKCAGGVCTFDPLTGKLEVTGGSITVTEQVIKAGTTVTEYDVDGGVFVVLPLP